MTVMVSSLSTATNSDIAIKVNKRTTVACTILFLVFVDVSHWLLIDTMMKDAKGVCVVCVDPTKTIRRFNFAGKSCGIVCAYH